MIDGLTNIGIDAMGNDCGRPSWGKVIFKALLLYMILAGFCWMECLFRDKGIEVDGTAEVIGAVNVKGRNLAVVRYHFRDPVSGQPRMNTVHLGEHSVPTTPVVKVEYVPGDFPSSRLKQMAHPMLPGFFFWVHVIFFVGLAAFIGWIALDANQPIKGNRIRFKKGSHLIRKTTGSSA